MLKAHYDVNGNIILVLDETRDVSDAIRQDIHHVTRGTLKEAKKKCEVDTSGRKTRKIPLMKRALYESKEEVKAEYAATAKSFMHDISIAGKELQSLPHRLHGSLNRLWKSTNAPMMIIGKRKRKPTTKLRMFMVDIVRFGGTFALIFTVLFVGVNYQSFFQIARAELALGSDMKTEQGLQEITDAKVSIDYTSFTATSRAASTTDILAYLPSVGPYEDRLIIPKLGKNVPIVKPSMDALVDENWKQFESDIQAALRNGVVHYPGSAKPGQAGNFFLTGHSSYYPWDDGKYKDVFALLPQLDIGDTYSVFYGGDKHTYRITKKYEVKPNDVTVLDQPTSERISTLMTCTPVGTTLRRLIVRAVEIDPSTGDILRIGQKSDEKKPTSLIHLNALPI